MKTKVSFHHKLIARSIATALGLTGASIATGQEASLEEIIVTSRQRAESSQDIPMMIQSLSGEDIQKQGIATLEDFSRFVGSLNVQSTTPGQNTIVFRGVSDGGGYLVDPTAAIYLDEQAMSMTSMAPDIYPVDIARIEALAGPQSTLFGASSQTGTIRFITNKPDASEFSGNFGLGASTVKSGDTGFDFDATLNIPLIDDKLAVRLSVFNSEQGGFIDSVLGTTVVDETNGGGGLKNNAKNVEEDINELSVSGARAAVKWSISDNWSALLSTNYQEMDADGFNDFDPDVGDLETVKFYDEYRTDEWNQTSLVIEGDLGFAQLTVAGSYYDRETMYQHDTQTYAAYFMYSLGAYYATYDFGTDPVGYLTNEQENTSKTLEVRLSHSGEKVSWTAGAFYMESDEVWDFVSYVDGYASSAAFEAWTAYATYYDMTLEPTDAWWHSRQGTKREDTAIFGEIEIDLSDRLTVLAGGRWYEVTKDLTYFNEKPGGLRIPAFGTGPIPPRTVTDDGFVPKIGLQYDINDDVMIYGVYSEGYRVGGVNRGKAAFPTLPNEYESDIIENTELGMKATWLDGRLQVNATLYEMKWKDVQIEITDPSNSIERPENDTVCLLDAEGAYVLDRCKNQPFQDAAANIGDATVRGADIDVKALIGDSVQVGFNITKLDEAYVDGPDGYTDDRFAGGQADLGLGPNTPLPLFADISYSLYVEYSAKVDLLGDGDFVTRVQHSHNGDSLNQLSSSDNSPRLTQGDFSVTDVIFGYSTDEWSAQLSFNNLTDERGITYKDSADFDPYYGRNSDNVIRPRNMKFSIRRFF